jgi:cobalt/nickel transport system ATP-binding protein
LNIIETKNLSYSYDNEQNALSNINISIKKASITAVLGGNGAGKSTLFLNLNGVFTPSSGEVYFENKKVNFDKLGLKELRKHIGIVFQDPNEQLFSASVRDDISFGAINLGMHENEVNKLLDEVAIQTGVAEFIDRPTHSLSFGQKKRVAIAGVLIMKPDVIILDEPTAGLDPHGVIEILDLILEISKKTGISVVIATHDIDIVPLYCDYAYVLAKGKIVLEGKPKELFQEAKKLRSYSLRLPRISHLMEILKKEDKLDVDPAASTISQARVSIKRLVNKYE